MPSWSRWIEVPGGGITQSGPRADGALLSVIRGSDNAIYLNRFLSGSDWTGWSQVPGMATDAAPCIGSFGGGVAIVAKGLDRRIYFNQLNGISPTDWHEVPGGGLTPSGPAVAGGVIIVRGTDDGIHYNGLKSNGSWSGWHEVAGHGKTPASPAISTFGQGYITLVQGTDNAVYYQEIGADLRTSGVWLPVPGGGATISGPAVAGSMVVVRGTNNLLYYNGFDGLSSWDGWREIPGGGKTIDSPGLALAAGFLTLMVRGENDRVYYNFWS